MVRYYIIPLTNIFFQYQPNDGMSHYERLRAERIARNKARLASLGFSDAPKEKTKKTPAKPRRSLQPEGPIRQNPGRAGRAQFNESAMAAMAVSARKERQVEEEKDPDACYTCQKEAGGECVTV